MGRGNAPTIRRGSPPRRAPWLVAATLLLAACGVRPDPGIADEFHERLRAPPAGWAAVSYLRDEGFRAWRAACPEALRPFVDRVAAVFTSG